MVVGPEGVPRRHTSLFDDLLCVATGRTHMHITALSLLSRSLNHRVVLFLVSLLQGHSM